MPLLKLWNSIRGQAAPRPAAEVEAADAAVSAKKPATGRGKSSTRGKGFGIFKAGPHGALCKELKAVSASKVLEIGVGDGTRAAAVVQVLAKHQPEVHYLAIDEFELAGGNVSLKAFHSRLRSQHIRPRLFPNSIDQGLMQVARTVGTVDVVIISQAIEAWNTRQTRIRLARICHDQTIVLYRVEEDLWRRLSENTPEDFDSINRAA